MCFTMNLTHQVTLIALLCYMFTELFYFVFCGICTKSECIEQANQFSGSIDTTINPCDDFVEFACGKQFKKFNEIMNISNNSKLLVPTSYRLHLWRIRNSLQNELDQSHRVDDNHSIKLAKTFWQNCKKITAHKSLEMIRFVFKKLGGWPIISENWNNFDSNNINNFSWDKFCKCSRQLGFFPRMFIQLRLTVDVISKSWQENDTIKLTIIRPKYLKVDNFDNVMKLNIGYFQIAKFISEKKIPLISEINEALKFAWNLHMLKCPDNPSNNVTNKKEKILSIKQLQLKFPIVNWMDFIRSILPSRQGQYLSDYNCVKVDICFLSSFDHLLKQTDIRIQANYAFLSIVDDLFSLIRPQLPLAIIKSQEDIEQICFDSTASIFKRALDVIIAKLPSQNLTDKLESMQQLIFNQTLRFIHNVSWMDLHTQNQARLNLEVTSFKKPFPDDIINDKYFKRLQFDNNDTVDIIFIKTNVFLIDRYYLQLGRPRNKFIVYEKDNETIHVIFDKTVSPTDATIQPSRFNNDIFVPAAAVLFNRLNVLPELDFVNYGIIGIQISSTLTHHMYQKGTHVDYREQLQTDLWWSEITQEQFMNRKSCQAIGPVKSSIDASIIFGFIGGMEIAYKTFFHFCSDFCNVTLPGLKYDTKQLFWISAVSSDCDKTIKERYNLVLSNNYDFINDFNCPVNSKMNIKDKCTIWV